MRPAQKGGLEDTAIGRCRGGRTIRIHPASGRHGDSPQANALPTGLRGVGHVIADAAYDLGAIAQIKINPNRTSRPCIDWRLYKEHHQVECFFNKLKRFGRIALRSDRKGL